MEDLKNDDQLVRSLTNHLNEMFEIVKGREYQFDEVVLNTKEEFNNFVISLLEFELENETV